KRSALGTPGAHAPGSPAAGDGFDFGNMLAEAASEQPTPRSTAGKRSAKPDDEEVPEAAAADEEPAAGSDDPFGFPAGGSPAEPKDAKNPPEKAGRKREPGPKGGAPTAGGQAGGRDEVLVIDAKTRAFDLLPPAAKLEVGEAPEGMPLSLEVEFDKVRRFYTP